MAAACADAVRGILETDVREEGDHPGLRECRHGQRQIALGHSKLAERIDNRNKAGLGKACAGAGHVCLGDPHFDVAIGKCFLERRDAG